VVALVATWRYMQHRLEASIPLLRVHREWAKQHADGAGLSVGQTADLLALLEDLLARGAALERKTSPADTAQPVQKETTDAEYPGDRTPATDR
jgi:hypothetical protein